jgi:copper chaperone NosL
MNKARRVATLFGFALAACSGGGPRPIEFGRDNCAQCRMQIVDQRFGGELVMATGKTIEFDAIDCLLDYARTTQRVQSTWVVDYSNPGHLIAASTAVFVETRSPGAPMGRQLIAVSSDSSAHIILERLGGRTVRWSDL